MERDREREQERERERERECENEDGNEEKEWIERVERVARPRECEGADAVFHGGEAADSLTEAVVILLTVVLFGVGWAHVELAGAAADADRVSGYAAGPGVASLAARADGPEPVSTPWTGGPPR